MLSSRMGLAVSRLTIHSGAFFVTALTLMTAAVALASFLSLCSFASLVPARSFASLGPTRSLASLDSTRASVPEFAAPLDGVLQAPAAEVGECAALEVGGAESASARSNASPGSNANARADSNPGRVIPSRQELPGLRSFGQVTPTLYRGARPTEEGFACLAKMGVSIVISLEGKYKDLRKPVERLGMQYVSMFWECSFPRDEIFARFLQLLRDNPGKKVFVYCHYGDDRTGMMIAAYRMAEQGWSAAEAKEEMKDFGFNFFHRRICTGLSDYEEHFPHHWRDGHAFEKLRSAAEPQR
jgi:tyrosine-protein phosphatase SIW14